MNNEDINNNISYIASKYINDKAINKSISSDKLMNSNEINTNIGNINLEDVELDNNLLKENDITFKNRSIINPIENVDLNSSSAVTIINNEIVPLNDIKEFEYCNFCNLRSISSNNSSYYKSNSFNNISSISQKIKSNGNQNMNSSPNKNISNKIITNPMINFKNFNIDSNQSSNVLSKFYQENNILKKPGDIERRNSDNFNVFEIINFYYF